MAYDFGGKVVLVTGAGKRIGRQIACDFARLGASVAVNDVNEAWAEETVAKIEREGGSAAPFATNVSIPSHAEEMVEQVARTLGPIDILINNAGIYPNRPVVHMSLEEWDAVYDLNLRAPFVLSRAAARQMLGRGAPGVIINISSGAASSARVGAAHYCGSKAALDMLTRVLAIELGPHRIRVVGIAPGLITDEPPLFAPGPPGNPYVNAILNSIPLGRTGVSSDVSRAVIFAASDEPNWITGTIIGVDGGSQAGRTHLPLDERNQ